MTDHPGARPEPPRPRRTVSDYKSAISVKVFPMLSSDTITEFVFADSSGPPAGIYKATFAGVTKTHHEEYGDGARFDFKIVGGEHDGRMASRTCKPQPTAKNATGRLMQGIVGAAAKPGEKVNLATFIGKTYTIVVGLAANGTSTRVESCIAA